MFPNCSISGKQNKNQPRNFLLGYDRKTLSTSRDSSISSESDLGSKAALDGDNLRDDVYNVITTEPLARVIHPKLLYSQGC